VFYLIRIGSLCLLLSMLSACGGGDSQTPPDTTPPPGSPPPESSSYNLYIQPGTLDIGSSPDTGNGAISLKVWGYAANETPSTKDKLVPGVLIQAREGKSITVEVKNTLPDPHGFSFPRLSVDEISPQSASITTGNTVSYTLTPKNAGVYLYQDAGSAGVNSAAGLFGAMIVRPDKVLGKVAWKNGPTFDKEVLWVMTDMDYNGWNLVALDTDFGPSKVDTNTYKADYFLMNGMNGFRAMEDTATQISGTLGEKILVRIVNAGQYSHSLHFHGNHFEVLSRNGKRLADFDQIDTINIKPKQTAIVRYTISQVGHYPMHVHTAQMETGNGVYLNGGAAMIIGKP